MSPPIHRRAFLRRAAATAVLVAGGWRGTREEASREETHEAWVARVSRELTEALPHAQHAFLLGGAARLASAAPTTQPPSQTSAETRIETSTERLLLDALGSDVPRLSGRALQTRVLDRTRADFRYGRVLFVEGWLLARTEAQLFAILGAT